MECNIEYHDSSFISTICKTSRVFELLIIFKFSNKRSFSSNSSVLLLYNSKVPVPKISSMIFPVKFLTSMLPIITFGHLGSHISDITFRLHSLQFAIFKNGSIKVPEQLFPGQLAICDNATPDIPEVEIASSDTVLSSLF